MGENHPTVPNNPSDEGFGGHDITSAESVEGYVTTTNTPFYPRVTNIFEDDGTPSGYDISFNQAYIFNRTSESQVQERDERKIENMDETISLPLVHEVKYFVEVKIDQFNFLIDTAKLTGISGDAIDNIGTDEGIQTSFPHIYFDQLDAEVGPYTGYFPILELVNGQLTEYTQRANIQLSDRQVRQLGNAFVIDDDEGIGGSAHILQEDGHRDETQPTRVKTIKAGSGVKVVDEYTDIVIHAMTGWSGANCCDYDAGTCGSIGGATPADADWWAYVDGTLMPSKFRGLKAGDQIDFTNSADDDACITEISCNPTPDPYYNSVSTPLLKIVPSEGGATKVEMTPTSTTFGTATDACYSTTLHGSVHHKLCNSDASSTAPVSKWYDTASVVVASIDANSANNSFINSGPLGIGTTAPVAGKAVTIQGKLGQEGLRVQNITTTEGTLELGDQTLSASTISFDQTANSLNLGAGISKLDCNYHDTFTLFDKCSTTISSQGGYLTDKSPATGSAILGGSGNAISGSYNVIVGGANQLISGLTMNFIGGGSGINIEESEFAVSIGGRNNDISGSNFGVIGGGYDNLISGGYSNVIGGGKQNIITGVVLQNTIAGGANNKIALSTSSMIAGGETNQIADGTYAFIGAGATNTIAGSEGSAIGGGVVNIISNSDYSFIAGGVESQITSADSAFTAGNYSRVEAGHDGAFVLSDSLTVPVLSTGADTMVLKFKSGVFIDGDSGLYINSANGIHINGNPVMTGVSDTDVDTLQSVTTRGDTTTTNIVSEKIVSGSTGFFDLIRSEGNLKLGPAGAYISMYDNEGNSKRLYGANVGLGYQTNAVSAMHVYLGAGVDSPDVKLTRDNAANVLGLRNSTAAQQFNIYNTYTSATNYERAALRWDDDVFAIETQTGSAGGDVRSLDFRVSGQSALYIDSGTQNVGIGVTNPAYPLQVVGNVDADRYYVGTNTYFGSAGTNHGLISVESTSYGLSVYCHSADLNINTADNAGLGFSNGHSANYNTVDTRLFRDSAGVLGLGTTFGSAANGTLLAGSVGIGVTVPVEDLEVSGTVVIGESNGLGDETSWLRLKGYEEHGIELWAHGGWTNWKISNAVNGALELYNSGTIDHGNQVYIGRKNLTREEAQANIMLWSTGVILRAGHNSPAYPILEMGIKDPIGASSSYNGDVYIDVRGGTTVDGSRFHFNKDGEFVASGVSVSGDVAGTGSAGRITLNGTPYLLSGDSPAETQTLQDVTTNGNTTTNDIYISGGTIYGDSTAPNIKLDTAGGSEFNYGTTSLVNGGALVWKSEGAEKVRFQANGDVGMGISGPLYKLHVHSTTTDEVARFESSDQVASISVADNAVTGYIGVDSVGGPKFPNMSIGLNSDMTSSSNLYITSDGSLGVGHRDPNHKLTVGGSIRATDNIELGPDSEIDWHNGNNKIVAGLVSDYSLSFQAYGGDAHSSATYTKLFIHSSGNVGVGLTNPAHRLHVSGSVAGTGVAGRITLNGTGYLLSGDSPAETQTLQDVTTNGNTTTTSMSVQGQYLSGVSGVFDSVDITGAATLTVSGNVGIGTATPSDVLHVNLANDGDKIHVSHGAMSALEIQRNGADDTIIKQGRAYTSAIQLKTAADDATAGFTLKGQGVGDGSFVGIGTSAPDTMLQVYGGDIKLASSDTPSQPFTLKARYAGLWMIGDDSPTCEWIMANQWGHDEAFHFKYTPATVGATGGIMKIGQQSKNHDNYTHGITAFYTDGTERMRIDGDGNVAIGTTTAHKKLHVVGDIWGYSSATDGDGDAYSVAAGSALDGNTRMAGLRFDRTNDVAKVGHYKNTSFIEEGYIAISSEGNVGIGTVTPSGKLQVHGNIRLVQDNKVIFGSNDGAFAGDSYQSIGGMTNSNDLTFRTYKDYIYKTLTSSSSETDGTERFRITQGGSVGIGTNDPAEKLEIMSGCLSLTSGKSSNIYLNSDTHNGGEHEIKYGFTPNYSSYPVSIVGKATAANSRGTLQIRVSKTTTDSVSATSADTVAEFKSGEVATYQKLSVHHDLIEMGDSHNAGVKAFKFTRSQNQAAIWSVPQGSYGRGDIRFTAGNDTAGTVNTHEDAVLRIAPDGGVAIGNAYIGEDISSGRLIVEEKVGIGTNAPDSPLEIDGRVAIRGANWLLFGQSTASYNSWTTRQYASTSTHKFNAQAFIFNDEGYGSSEFMRITNDGYVGVGLANPIHTLHVSGSVAGTGVAGRITLNGTGYLLSGDSPAETQTLQDVTTNGNTTTTSILSTGPHISGVTGLFSSRVGIGITDPARTLHIYEAATDTDVFVQADSANAAVLYLGETNTAIYRPANTSDLRLFQGGADVLSIKGGKVGIGTTAPAQKLHAAGITRFSNASSNYIEIDGSRASDNNAVISNQFNQLILETNEGAGDPDICLLPASGGNVGIGNNSPAYPLSVSSAAYAVDNYIDVYVSNSKNAGILFRDPAGGRASITANTDNDLVFATNGTGSSSETMRILDDGKVGIGTIAPATELYVKRASSAGGANADTIFQVENDDHANIVISTPSAKVGRFGFGDASNSLKGFTAYDHGSDQMTFQVNSATAMTIDSAGNVGIGSTPTNKLDVFGHFTATTKSFLIDHPTKENKKLQYASLEGPEHAVYVRGTHDGSLIELPEYWSELVHKDSLTVSLTPLGEHQNLYVKYKDATCISVGGVKGSYDYIVYGERKDTDKLEVEPLKV